MGNGIFTRNYDNIVALTSIPVLGTAGVTVFAGGFAFTDGDLTLKNTEGALKTSFTRASSWTSSNHRPFSIFDKNAINSYGSVSEDIPSNGIWFGSNNTEETYDNNTILSQLSISSSSSSSVDLSYNPSRGIVLGDLTYDSQMECWRRSFSIIFTACRECTLGEIAFYYKLRGTSNANGGYCVYRKAFTEPYHFNENDMFTFEFELVIPANPSKPISINTNIS